MDEEGVHWEYSPNYHRLVLEMVLGCLILLDRHSVRLPANIREKTIRMLDFVWHYRKCSGGVPLVRDIDSGRFCILGGHELTNHDHALALGAIFFNKDEFYPGKLFEDCFWYLGACVYDWHSRQAQAPKPPSSRLFRPSGFCFMRQDSNCLMTVCCPKGMRGLCGHTHNDFLSFELEANGRPFLTDCGSYLYFRSSQWRNRFRATAAHNTVLVDRREQNALHPTDLFEIESHTG